MQTNEKGERTKDEAVCPSRFIEPTKCVIFNKAKPTWPSGNTKTYIEKAIAAQHSYTFAALSLQSSSDNSVALSLSLVGRGEFHSFTVVGSKKVFSSLRETCLQAATARSSRFRIMKSDYL
jgi:hypothetical protein